MRRMMRLAIGHFGYAAAVLTLGMCSIAMAQTTVTFQQGANGYNDVTQMRISMSPTAGRDGTDGNAVTNYLIDGWQTDNPETPAIEADSPDEQDLIRFDNIMGSNAGQIPLGATILDAQLTYKTHSGGSAQSGGPFGVAGLLQPFTLATRYDDFPSANGNPLLPSRGAWFQDGEDVLGHPYATRSAGGFAGPQSLGPPPTGTNNFNGTTSAEVFPLIQQLADGQQNHGFVVQAGWTGETNGWGFWTSGAATVADRPKLSVTYTQNPVGITSFQRDVNSYTGDTYARLSSGADINGAGDDITIDGTTETGAFFIDGNDAGVDPRLRGLVKFTNVFGAGAGQAPSDKPVLKAWLVLTTGLGGEHGVPGPVHVHEMLRDWDTTSLYTNFGAAPGLTEADGDIGPVLDSNYGMINGSQSWFDVTSYLENARLNPLDPDYGLALIPGTNNGWAVHMNGATDPAIRPRLVVYSDLSEAPEGLLGDYNDDGAVDAADYVIWRKGGPLANEGDVPGTVNGGDYNFWKAHYGEEAAGAGGAVPEPATWLLGLVACAAFAAVRKR
jgi:hypothetical protein